MNKRLMISIFCFALSLMAWAQASGGQITRKKMNTTTTTQSHTTDKKTQNVQNRLSQQRRAAQLQAERERKERMEQERAERERIAQAERERQEQEAREQAAKEVERTRIIQNLVNNMVFVQGGTFTMGATAEQGSDAWDNEKPAHQVTLLSFSIGRYEVTQEEWEAVMGSNPSKFKGSRKPVERVSWDDCKSFISKLNSITGKNFRLPTEAEWEFASRGGIKSRGYKYSGSNNLNSVAWYDDNSGNATHVVGQKSPNELGIYDMSGNVWEWCSDWYGNYSSSSQTNPTGSYSGSRRVYRGGSWFINAGGCRSSFRLNSVSSFRCNYLGFRLAQ